MRIRASLVADTPPFLTTPELFGDENGDYDDNITLAMMWPMKDMSQVMSPCRQEGKVSGGKMPCHGNFGIRLRCIFF